MTTAPAQASAIASVLAIDGLCVDRGGRRVLTDIDLTLAPGDLRFLVGPNGSGKTTLLRTVAGLLAPAGGVIVCGDSREVEERRLRLHYAGHATALKPTQTVRQTLVFWAEMLGVAADEDTLVAAMDAMDLLPLEMTACRYLSSGQQRRLALARLALVPRPLWLLDEPTVGLDRASCRLLDQLLADHLANGGAALVATHVPLGVAGNDFAIGRPAVAGQDT